jgi:hypothetical protein
MWQLISGREKKIKKGAIFHCPFFDLILGKLFIHHHKLRALLQLSL